MPRMDFDVVALEFRTEAALVRGLRRTSDRADLALMERGEGRFTLA